MARKTNRRGKQTKKLARKRAGGGRSGCRKQARAVARRAASDAVFELADALETPLRRTQDLVMALHYVGYGLSHLAEDSAPAVNGLAEALEGHVHEMRAVLGFER